MAKAKKKKYRKLDRNLPVMRPNAAGIDIGATEIFVAVPADRDAESVRSFPSFTQDLHELADWLQRCRVDTVAMESTSVYWIPLFQILEARGIEVHLVNAQHVPCARSKIRRVGLPMASISAFGGFAEGVVSPRARRLRDSLPDAAPPKPRRDGLRACAAYA